MSVGEYAAKFESLSRYFRFFQDGVDDGYMCHRFQDGLKYEIQDSVMPLGIQQFHPLVEKCRDIETMKNRRLNRGNNSNSGGPIRSNNQNHGREVQGKKPYHRSQGSKEDPLATNSYCYRCGDPDHYTPQCNAEGRLCYNCRKTGHVSKDCNVTNTAATSTATKATRQTAPGRVYCIEGKETSSQDDHIG
ncbi:TIR-NBS-LRR resistance protein [Trifolium medium]|uniref:TIR-NBS-LRR resistance protein n=1 Tax=Trifolium medium TaxID=97028 RepID=A0A392MVC7_9FABA|nr:TIR-NBS-LRR resistance protein [Trifolium medium]